MIKLSNAGLLFEKQVVYSVLTSKSTHSATLQKVIIIYQSTGADLPSTLREMLEKLVLACKYQPSDVVYVNTVKEATNLGVLKATYSPEVVLVFGDIEISRNLPKLKRNQPFELDGMKVIYAEVLDKLNANPKEKAALWAGLQKMMAL